MASNGTMGLVTRNKAGFKRKDLSPTQQKKYDELNRAGKIKGPKNGIKRLTAGAMRELGG